MYIKTIQIAGFEGAFHGMRNPMNSWDKSDSLFLPHDYFSLGERDLELAKKLIKGGGEHRKFLRQIQVWADFNMPRYWWSEFDTYHFNTKNSCSTMHKLMETKLSPDLFIHDPVDYPYLLDVIAKLEEIQKAYKIAKTEKRDGDMERCLIRAKRLLPEGFLQMRTVNTNYEELANIYHQRKNHRLKEEWIDTFCAWCETLPYFRELCIDTRG